MSSSVNSIEDVVNNALQRIGYTLRIGAIYDGSKAAKLALDLYAQTRDALLAKQPWGFATRNKALTASKTAPVGGYGTTAWSSSYPLLPYVYEYPYPADCIRVRYLVPIGVPFPVLDPAPVEFQEANDNSTNPATRVILSNLATPVLIYTGQITDMTTWDPPFINLMTATLAKKFLAALRSGQEMIELMKMDSEDAAANETDALAETET